MYSFLTRYKCQTCRIITGINNRFFTKITETLGSVEPKQKRLEFVTEDIRVIDNSEGTRSTTIPLIEPSGWKVSRNINEIPMTESEGAGLEKSLLNFEDIPGPAVLKIWEKYWKYVPIFGTQLAYSLLLNHFTVGKLRWNTHFKPVKYLFDEYGPIVRINGPMINDVVMIHRPDHIAQVFRQDDDNPIRCRIDVLEHYCLNYRKYRLPGLFSMQGTEWPEFKAKLEEPFIEQTSKCFSSVDTICNEFAQSIGKIRNLQDEVPEHFDKELLRWGMECFSTLMFNKRLGFLDSRRSLNSSSEISGIIDAVSKAHLYLCKCETGFQVWRFFETPYLQKFIEACDVIDNLVSKYVRQAGNKLSRKSSFDNEQNFSSESSPLLEILLMRRKMNPDDISALLIDMIILGVQATVNTQAFLLYFLAKNPRVQRKLYEEIMSILPTRGSSLTYESCKQMTYLKACIKECLRLRPAFPYINRITSKTINLHGYTIPKGTCLIVANEISCQREENFENPTIFKPERWLTEDMNDNSWQEFSCLPFGHGARSCLGKNIAVTKIMLLTSKLVREFRIEYDYADIGSKYLMINVPNRRLKFRFVDRQWNL